VTPTEALELLDEITGDVETAESSDRFAGMDYIEPQMRRGVGAELAELRRVLVAALEVVKRQRHAVDVIQAWISGDRAVFSHDVARLHLYFRAIAAFDAATKGTDDAN